MALQKPLSTRYGVDFPTAYHMIVGVQVERLFGFAVVRVAAFTNADVRVAQKDALTRARAIQTELERITGEIEGAPANIRELRDERKRLNEQFQAVAAEADKYQPLPDGLLEFRFKLADVGDADGNPLLTRVYTRLKADPAFADAVDLL